MLTTLEYFFIVWASLVAVLIIFYIFVRNTEELIFKTGGIFMFALFLSFACFNNEDVGGYDMYYFNRIFTWVTVTYSVIGLINYFVMKIKGTQYGFLGNNIEYSAYKIMLYFIFWPSFGVSTILEFLFGSQTEITNRIKYEIASSFSKDGEGAASFDGSDTFKFLNYFFYKKNRSLRYTDEDTGSKIVEKTVLYSTVLLFLTAGIPLIITGAKDEQVNNSSYYRNLQPVLTVVTGLIILLVYGTLESADAGYTTNSYRPSHIVAAAKAAFGDELDGGVRLPKFKAEDNV